MLLNAIVLSTDVFSLDSDVSSLDRDRQGPRLRSSKAAERGRRSGLEDQCRSNVFRLRGDAMILSSRDVAMFSARRCNEADRPIRGRQANDLLPPPTAKRLSYALGLALKSQCVYVKVRSPRQPAAIASNPSRCVGTLKVCSWILRRSLVNLRRLQHCMRRIAQGCPWVLLERSLAYTAPSLCLRYAPGPPFVD